MLGLVLDHGIGVQVTRESLREAILAAFDIPSLRLLLGKMTKDHLYDTEFITAVYTEEPEDYLLFELVVYLLEKGQSDPLLVDYLLKFGSDTAKIASALAHFPSGNHINLSTYAINYVVELFRDDQAILFFMKFPASTLLRKMCQKSHVSQYLEREIDNILENLSPAWCRSPKDLLIGIKCCRTDLQALQLIESAVADRGIRIKANILDRLIKGRFDGSCTMAALKMLPDLKFKGSERAERAIAMCYWPHQVNLAVMQRIPDFKLTSEIASLIHFTNLDEEFVIEYAKYIEDPLVALRFVLILGKSAKMVQLFLSQLDEVEVDPEDAQKTIKLAQAHQQSDEIINLLGEKFRRGVN
jgi:hypothetical protein